MFLVNYLAVVVSLIASTLLGMLWYGPFFGKSFMKFVSFDGVDEVEMKKSQTAGYIASLLSGFIALLTLAVIMKAAAVSGAWNGALFGALAGFGLIAMTLVGEAAWHRTPWGLVLMNSGYRILGMALGGLIIGIW